METPKDNQFIVDLGDVKLTPVQVERMNAAIQKAVAGQLASINQKGQLALYPITKFPKGPIINGIYARLIRPEEFNKVIEISRGGLGR